MYLNCHEKRGDKTDYDRDSECLVVRREFCGQEFLGRARQKSSSGAALGLIHTGGATQRTCKLERFSFDVACEQCEHSL